MEILVTFLSQKERQLVNLFQYVGKKCLSNKLVMKSLSAYVKSVQLLEELVALVLPVNNMIDTLSVEQPDVEKQTEGVDFDPIHDVEKANPWDGTPKAYDLHPDSFGGEDFPPIVSPEEEAVIK